MIDLYTYIIVEAVKKTGINSSLNSKNGEDEILVAFAVNKVSGFKPKNDRKALEKLIFDPEAKYTKKELESRNKKLEKLLKIYKENKDKVEATGNAILKQLGGKIEHPFRKLKNSEVKVREGIGKVNGTPKTDLVSGDGKNFISLSLKKANSSGAKTQFLSSYPQDLLPIFKNCASHIDKEEDRKKLNDFFENWPEYKTHDEDESKLNNETNNKKAELINYMFSKYPKFRQAVFREAITGNNKFEDGSPAVPQHMLVWDFDNPNEGCHVQNALDFADSTAAEYSGSGVVVRLSKKSMGRDDDGNLKPCKSALRMEDDNSKHNYSYHNPENGDVPNNEIEWTSEIKAGDTTFKNAEDYMQENVGYYQGKQRVPDVELYGEGKEEEVEDPETGKKVKKIVFTGPRGGRFYKSDKGNKVYI